MGRSEPGARLAVILMVVPSLSVVIPTHNTRGLVMSCVDSLGDAGAAPVEVIVVDDASTDGTAEAIRKHHPAAVVIETGRNMGFGAAANLGAAATTGEIVLVLNSDTEVLEGGLAALVAAFAEDPELGIAGAELLDPDGAPQWRAGSWPTRRWLFAQASGLGAVAARVRGRAAGAGSGAARVGEVDWVSGAAMAVRRDVWESCGPFDVGYSFYCQDLDLCCAARRAGRRVAVVAGFAVLHHHGATIAVRPGASGSFHPGHLWADLVRFSGKFDGPEAAQSAAAALRAGAKLRLLGRAMASPFVREREAWSRESRAFREGLKSL